MSTHTRQELIDYALRKLGGGVIKVSATPDQISDRVDEALQFFQDFHYDGTERVYLKHKIVGTRIVVVSVSNFIVGETVVSAGGATFQIASIDVLNNTLVTKVVFKAGQPEGTFAPLEVITGASSFASTSVVSKIPGDIENRSVSVSDMVTGVIRAIPWWSTVANKNYIFDPHYQAVMVAFNNVSDSSLIYYSQLMSQIALMDQVLRPIDSLRFNRKASTIYLDFDWNMAEIGSFIVFECYRILDPEVFHEIYNDRMLKKLVTAKIKYQWATNLQLYAGIQLLGGVTVDASSLMAQAVGEIASAEQEIIDTYSLPSIGFIG